MRSRASDESDGLQFVWFYYSCWRFVIMIDEHHVRNVCPTNSIIVVTCVAWTANVIGRESFIRTFQLLNFRSIGMILWFLDSKFVYFEKFLKKEERKREERNF